MRVTIYVMHSKQLLQETLSPPFARERPQTMASGNEAQQVRCAELVQKLGGPTAEMALREARFGLVAQSLARSIANGADPDTVAQALAEALPSATTIR